MIVAAHHVADVPQGEEITGTTAGDQVRIHPRINAGHEQGVGVLVFGEVLDQGPDFVCVAAVVFVDAQEDGAQRRVGVAVVVPLAGGIGGLPWRWPLHTSDAGG
ncbi:hypothetical protein, partial [Paenarthrobacter nicotinovorans]|uniref:hypothetical protein n=1 Tax=Paenarthrobacter nicotinovorans TaxID=29320 RepID=UPI003CCFD21C